MSPSSTLHMETEEVRAIAARLSEFSTKLGNCYDQIGRAAFGIVWTGPAHNQFMAEISKWAYGITSYIENSSSLSTRLYAEATEWEDAAATFLATASKMRSYVHPENANSADPERIADIKIYLMATPYSQEILKELEKEDVKIVFGPLEPPEKVAETSPDGKTITIDIDHANMSDAELAAVLVHEGTHVMQADRADDQWGIFGQISANNSYKKYPWDNEYEAYRAEAEYWRAIKKDLPESPILTHAENLIFEPDGDLRPKGESCQMIHDMNVYPHTQDPKVEP